MEKDSTPHCVARDLKFVLVPQIQAKRAPPSYMKKLLKFHVMLSLLLTNDDIKHKVCVCKVIHPEMLCILLTSSRQSV